MKEQERKPKNIITDSKLSLQQLTDIAIAAPQGIEVDICAMGEISYREITDSSYDGKEKRKA